MPLTLSLPVDSARLTAAHLPFKKHKILEKFPQDRVNCTTQQAKTFYQAQACAAGSALFALSTAGTACNDIAELIFHATMRLIAAEETALNKLLDDQK